MADRALDLPGENPVRQGSAFAYGHALKGELLALRGDLSSAKTEMKAAVVADSSDFYLRIKLAIILMKLGDFHGAKRHIDRVLKADGANEFAWLALAMFHELEGREDKSVAAARRAMKVEPDRTEAPLWLAGFFRDRNQKRRALEVLRRVVEKHPGNAAALLSLGQISLELENHKEAEKYLAQFLDIKPHRTDVLDELAHVYVVRGETQRAANLLTVSISKAPGDPVRRKKLIVLLMELGQDISAVRHLESLPPMEPGHLDDRLDRACMYARAGYPYRGRTIIVSQLGHSPTDPAARLTLAKIELSLGRLEIAQALLGDPQIMWSEEQKKDIAELLNKTDWLETDCR
jgi:Flp pilus assembly protein TadD